MWYYYREEKAYMLCLRYPTHLGDNAFLSKWIVEMQVIEKDKTLRYSRISVRRNFVLPRSGFYMHIVAGYETKKYIILFARFLTSYTNIANAKNEIFLAIVSIYK